MARKRQTPKLPVGVTLKPVSLVDLMEITSSIEMEYRENGEPLDVPTYTIKVGDDEQTHEHEHILDDDGNVVKSTLETEEDHAAWEAHINAQARLETEVALYSSRYIMLEGIDIDWSQYNGWEEKKKKYRITIPDDPDDKKLYFIMSVAFPTQSLQEQVAQNVMLLSAEGSDPERIEAIEALFRS